MEKHVLNLFIIILTVLTAGFFILVYTFPSLHLAAMELQEPQENRQETVVLDEQSVLALLRPEEEALDEQASFDHQIRLEMPSYMDMTAIEETQDYMTRTVQLTIPGIDEAYFNDFPMIGSSDKIEDITYANRDMTGVVSIRLDAPYLLQTTTEGQYLYLDFPAAKEVYDHVVVIDAGHGGRDPGADVEGIYEKDLNLAMLLDLKELFDQDGEDIGVFYTRTEDTNPSLESRVALANGMEADLFLSIHQNSTGSGRMSAINGTSVMYLVSDTSGASKAFAQHCLDALLAALGSQSKGLVAGDDILIIRDARVPVALAEIGFMTNEEELALLAAPAYQEQAAQALHDAILLSLEE